MRAHRILITAAVVAAGCGGASRDDFAEKANANCRERQKIELANLDKPDAKPGEWIDVYDAEIEKQRDVEAPEELEADWKRYQEHMRASAEAYRYASGERELDPRSVAEGKALREAVRGRKLAREMGLDVCAKQIY